VLGDCSREVVVPKFASHTTEGAKGMEVTADKGLEALAVCKLQVHLAAVAFDQTEGVKLTRGAVIGQRAEVPPVDIAALARSRLYA
jgi:hypothetical protein